MCKVLMLTNTAKVKDFKQATKVIHAKITARDRDGFGYAAFGESGVFGERALGTSFQSRINRPVVGLPITSPVQNVFGIPSKPTGPALFHGRISTNSRTLLNTHPMVKDGVALIHNGVVTDHGPKYAMQTTNDSEHVLHRYLNGGIDEVAKQLTGYYAFGAIDAEGVLHVVRDRIATLNIAWCETIESFIIATTVDLIEDVSKTLKWKVSAIDPVSDDTFAVFKGNELVSHGEFTSLGYGTKESKYASKSLGRELDAPSSASSSKQSKFHFLDQVESSHDVGGIVDASSTSVESNQYRQASFELFLEEVKNSDASYQFFGNDGQMERHEFMKLSDVDKAQCDVYRADGSFVDPDDYYSTLNVRTRADIA